MGLAVWLCTIIAEQLNNTRVGRMVTTAVAVFVIAWAIILALGLISSRLPRSRDGVALTGLAVARSDRVSAFRP